MVSVILGHSYHVYVCLTVNVAAQVTLCYINAVNCESLLRIAGDWSGSHMGTSLVLLHRFWLQMTAPCHPKCLALISQIRWRTWARSSVWWFIQAKVAAVGAEMKERRWKRQSLLWPRRTETSTSQQTAEAGLVPERNGWLQNSVGAHTNTRENTTFCSRFTGLTVRNPHNIFPFFPIFQLIVFICIFLNMTSNLYVSGLLSPHWNRHM